MFRSLADDQGSLAIGVVLSGTGSDGTFGLKAIKAAGGITLVQDPASAKYDGMPRSALASGAADYCLTVERIGHELARIAKAPHRPARAATSPLRAQDQLAKLFVLIRSEFGNDLSHYKQATIERRIERRMTLHRLGRLEDYVRLVQQDHDELRALYKDMLITVTRFFRDAEVFDALTEHVLPKIFEHKEVGAPLRVWVPRARPAKKLLDRDVPPAVLREPRQEARIQSSAPISTTNASSTRGAAIYPRTSRTTCRRSGSIASSQEGRRLPGFSPGCATRSCSRGKILKDAPFSRIDLASCRNCSSTSSRPRRSACSGSCTTR